MPTYIRPDRVDVTEGSLTGSALALLLALAVPLLVIVSLVAFVLAHLVVLAIAAVVFTAVLGGYIAFTRWLASPGQFEKQHRPQRATRAVPRPARALPAPPLAIEPVRVLPARPDAVTWRDRHRD